MIISDLIRFGTQGAFAALLLSHHARLWELVVLQVIRGAATAFFKPASVGLTPQNVSPHRLQQANALLSLTISSSSIVGPSLSGLLVATLGPGWAIALDSLTFALSAALLSRLHLPSAGRQIARQRFLSEFLEGWEEVRSRAWALASILNFMFFQLLVLAAFQVLGPLIAKQSLGGAPAWAVISASVGAGSVLGDLLGLYFKPRRPLLIAFVALLGVLPALILLALAAPAPAVAGGAVLVGAAFSFPTILWFTALQESIPSSALSRVSSFDFMGSTALRPIGYALAGPAAAAFGAKEVLLAAALLYGLVDIATIALPSIARFKRRGRIPGAVHDDEVTRDDHGPAGTGKHEETVDGLSNR
jgi:predicted MFS family arabinose efflux permease